MKPLAKRTPWLVIFRPCPRPRLRLLCFPYAGAGAGVFRNWQQHLPDDVELAAVQLPGREVRLRETPFRRMTQLIDTLARELLPFCDVPVALFGHSLGTLLAFEVARTFRRQTGPRPLALFVSGRRAPQFVGPASGLHELPDDALVRELQRRYGGVPDVIAADPELQRIFLPTVRADLELVDSYAYLSEPPLDCPLTAFGGLHDAVPRDELEAWQTQSSGPFALHLLPGDHFFLNTQTARLAQLIVEQLGVIRP